jgi:hypothetical protein
MSINVYWSCLEPEWMAANNPLSVSKLFWKNKDYFKKNTNFLSSINQCPSFNDNLKNLYALESLYNYSFCIDLKTNIVSSKDVDQPFFDEHVLIRSIEQKLFSFRQKYIFFTDVDSLETTFYEFPFLEDNNITKRCIPVPGKYDIAKWFRNTEFAFYLKKDFDEFKIEKNEIYSYIRFHTKEKIIFKQFVWNDVFQNYLNNCLYLNSTALNLKKINEYYLNFKIKKHIIKEIKNNLL